MVKPGDLVTRRGDRTGVPGLVKLVTTNGAVARVDFPGRFAELVRVDQLVPVVVLPLKALAVIEAVKAWRHARAYATGDPSLDDADLTAAVDALEATDEQG